MVFVLVVVVGVVVFGFRFMVLVCRLWFGVGGMVKFIV